MRMSSMRPLVQLPMTTWSIQMSRASAAGRVLLGRCGKATVGTMVGGIDLDDRARTRRPRR